MAVNVLPSKQPIPSNADWGPCPVVGTDAWKENRATRLRLTVSGETMLRRVKDLEARLATETEAAERCIAKARHPFACYSYTGRCIYDLIYNINFRNFK